MLDRPSGVDHICTKQGGQSGRSGSDGRSLLIYLTNGNNNKRANYEYNINGTYLLPTMGPQHKNGWSHSARASMRPTSPVPPRMPTGESCRGGHVESLCPDTCERTSELIGTAYV